MSPIRPALMSALLLGAATAAAQPLVQLDFPHTPDGRYVQVVDLHTHSVFSDGRVWPYMRVREARREHVDAVAITEHLEYQPHKADIPHPDRNRAFEIALEEGHKEDERPIIVLNGAEITRSMPPGHINAVFLEDANAMLVDDYRAGLEAAAGQGAFIFWNHPYWRKQEKDGVAKMQKVHRALIRDDLIHGVEVANGADYAEDTLAIALKYDLTILGTSDIHGITEWDYQERQGRHRTVTLALTADTSEDALREALFAGHTVALVKETFIGRAENLEPVLAGMLTVSTEQEEEYDRLEVRISNSGPLPLVFRQTSERYFYDAHDIFTVAPGSEFVVHLKEVAPGDRVTLPVQWLNAYQAPREHLEIDLMALAVTPGES